MQALDSSTRVLFQLGAATTSNELSQLAELAAFARMRSCIEDSASEYASTLALTTPAIAAALTTATRTSDVGVVM